MHQLARIVKLIAAVETLQAGMTLAETLVNGNLTGGNDIVISEGDAIIAEADLGGPGIQSGALRLQTGNGSVSVGPVELLPGDGTGATAGGGVLAIMGSSSGGSSGTFEISPGTSGDDSPGGDIILPAGIGDGIGAGGISRLSGGQGGATDAAGGTAELIGGAGGGANGDSGGVIIGVGVAAAGGADGTIQLVVGADTYTWPTADGSVGQHLVTDGNGVLSFTASGTGSETLAETLVHGNVSGGTDLVISAGDILTTDVLKVTAAAAIDIQSNLSMDVSAGNRTVTIDSGTGSNALEFNAPAGTAGLNSFLHISNALIDAKVTDGADSVGYDIDGAGGMRIFDALGEIGLFYHADYSTTGIAAKGDRWIADRGYVDTQIATIGAATSSITFGGGDVTGSGTADRFLNPWSQPTSAGTTEVFLEPWAFPGAIDQLRAVWGASAGSVNVDFVLRVNGIDTALKFTALSDAGAGTDLVNVAAISAGDRVSFVVRKSAATGSAMGDMGISMRVVAA